MILKRFGEDQVLWKSSVEAGFPERLQELRRGSSPHLLDDRGQRDRSSGRETVEDRAHPEPVIAVTVRDVDRGEVLAVRSHPLGQVGGLAGRQHRVDKHRVPFARDKRRRDWRPVPFFLAWSQVVAGQRLRLRYVHVPAE